MRRMRVRALKPNRAAERYYREQLNVLIKTMQDIAVSELKTPVNDAMFSVGIKRLSSQMDKMLERMEALNITAFAKNLAQGFVERMYKSSTRNFDKSLPVPSKAVYSEDMQALIDVKVAENVALIKSIKNDYVTSVGDLVRENVVTGIRSTTLITDIKEKGKVSESRAKFIARDQTAKLNSQITQIKAQNLGSDTYYWHGSLDSRERESHVALEGMLCKYSDPNVYSDDDGKTWKQRSSIGAYIGHVGEDFQCRCVARVVVNW